MKRRSPIGASYSPTCILPGGPRPYARYSPGVWFDFFLDDMIVSRINNIPEEDVRTYKNTRQRILDFLRPYQPSNLRMTITGVGSLFASRKEYEDLLDQNIKKLADKPPGGLPQLTAAQRAATTLNVKATPEQLSDPQWREKVELVHSAYANVKGSTGYSTASNKIRVFTQPLPNGSCIPVGTTKDSIVKFWVGVGALKPLDNTYRQLILSPNHLKETEFTFVPVTINGLDGKNFHKIRVLK